MWWGWSVQVRVGAGLGCHSELGSEGMGFVAGAVTSRALSLCLRFLAGPLPRHYSGCKNRVWHQSARETLRKAGAVITYQGT